mmetsp:Transcript_30878/g.82772  ORF Transcript_30878/g.82772 Transcript_30878/m.82772 type:complete len:244 (+) Transcript_30878:197-928(+)
MCVNRIMHIFVCFREGGSAYMRQILADREKYGPMLLDLAPQIATFNPVNMDQVVVFMAEVERRLGRLSDERMVLKGEAFAGLWPEGRLETFREAIARRLELEGLLAGMDPSGAAWGGVRGTVRSELQHAVEKFENVSAALETFRRGQDDLERKFRADRIPFDFARVKKVQVGAVGLAKYAMNMVLTSHQGLLDKDTPPEQAAAQIDTLAEPALRFAFRCHQFAGGFDEEANRLFMQLRSLLSL